MVVLLLVLAAVGCTGDDRSRPEGASTTDEPLPRIPRGGALVFGLEAEVRTLAPGEVARPSEVTIALGIYDPLLTYVDGKVEPFLARSIESNDDLTEYEIDLREDVSFHDGTPLNADAVVEHFERLKDPATRCSCFAKVAQIASMETPDGPEGTRVVFNLIESDVTFLDLLAGPVGYIESPAAAASGMDFEIDGVGTGPFELETYAAGERAVLVANRDYWGTDASGDQLPYLDKITFVPSSDSGEVLAELEHGDIDLLQTTDSKVVKRAEVAGFATHKTSTSGSLMILMNNSKPPFDDVRARRALAHALDKDLINELAYDGVAVPSYSGFGLETAYYNPDAGTPEYDPGRAVELIDELDGLRFTIECPPTPESQVVLPIIEQLGRAVGMTITVEEPDERTFVNRMYGKDGDYEAACFRNPDFTEPDAVRHGLTTDDPGNLVFYSNPEVDQLLVEARQTIDFERRKPRYDQVQELLAADVPFVTLVYDVFATVYDTQRVGPPPDGEPGARGAIKPGLLFAIDR